MTRCHFVLSLWSLSVSLTCSFVINHAVGIGIAPLRASHLLLALQAPNDASDEPVTRSFADLGLAQTVIPAVKSKGWLIPTPIQQLAIPELLSTDRSVPHKAVWCEAPTGGGKTACYVLPLLQNLLQTNKRHATKGHVKALVVCPTRELAVQIGSVVHDLASHTSSTWRIVVVTGGVPREPQLQRLAECAAGAHDIDILIATPGRLVDVLQHYTSRMATNNDINDKDIKTKSRKSFSTTRFAPSALIETRAASEAALERRLLAALDARGKQSDQSLSLDQIQKLKLDRFDDEGRASLPTLLQHVPYLVLDEADRLLSRTFETEMDNLLAMVPVTATIPRHTWLFSATFPKHVEPRVNAVLNRRVGQSETVTTPVIRISCTHADRSLDANTETSSSLLKKLERTTPEQQHIEQVGPASTIGLRTIRLERRDRTQALRLLLDQNPTWDRVIVFCATRYAAEHVSRKLRRVGIESAELHGKLDQDAQTRRLSDLTRGKVRVLLATDVASRGLDIVGLPAVLNYDLPRSPADFVHRIGRTGRAGLSGQAVTFVTPDSEAHWDLIEQRYLLEPVKRETLPGFEPDEEAWHRQAQGSRDTVPGSAPSDLGLAHDKMFGGVKGRRKSKKDKIREAQAPAGAGTMGATIP